MIDAEDLIKAREILKKKLSLIQARVLENMLFIKT